MAPTNPSSSTAVQAVLIEAKDLLRQHYILFIVGIVFARLFYLRYLSPYRDIPGPFLATISPLWRLRGALNGTLHKDITEGHKKYGTIFRIAPDEVSISDPEAIKTIYAHGAGSVKTDFYSVWGPYPARGGLFTHTDEAAHAAERRLVANAYSLSSLLEMEPYVDGAIEEMCTRMGGFADKPIAVNMAFWMQAYAFDVVGELAFGRAFGFLTSGQDVGGQMANLKAWLRKRFACGMVPWFFPIFMSPLVAVFSSSSSADQEDQKARLKFTAEAVKARMDRPTDRRDMLSRFIEARHPDGTPLSLDEVLIEAGTVVGAGSDTTGISLRAMLYYIITNPEVYAKLTDEINTFAKNGEISNPVTFSESLKMPYFCACVKEALRMHSAVGYVLPRHVPKGGKTLAGRYFPEGSKVGVHAWTIHRDESIFGPETDKFRPERWLRSPESAKNMDRYNLAFGHGARICVGKNISLMEMQKLLPTLFRRYHFELVDPKKPWKTTCHWFVHQEDMDCYVTKAN